MYVRVCVCVKVRQQEFAKLRFCQILIFSTFKTIRQIFCPPNFPAIRYVVILPVPI